jgi:hypothetical protein
MKYFSIYWREYCVEIKFKNRMLQRSVTSVETGFYPPTALTEVAMLI